MLHLYGIRGLLQYSVTNLKSFVTDATTHRIRMELTFETLPYKHIVNLYENTFLLTSMTRTYILQTGIPAESVTPD